jgi:hypothetical protein
MVTHRMDTVTMLMIENIISKRFGEKPKGCATNESLFDALTTMDIFHDEWWRVWWIKKLSTASIAVLANLLDLIKTAFFVCFCCQSGPQSKN